MGIGVTPGGRGKLEEHRLGITIENGVWLTKKSGGFFHRGFCWVTRAMDCGVIKTMDHAGFWGAAYGLRGQFVYHMYALFLLLSGHQAFAVVSIILGLRPPLSAPAGPEIDGQ